MAYNIDAPGAILCDFFARDKIRDLLLFLCVQQPFMCSYNLHNMRVIQISKQYILDLVISTKEVLIVNMKIKVKI